MKVLLSVMVGVAALGTSACSDDTPAVCVAKEQLLASVQELRDYDIVGSGLDGLQERIDAVVADLGEVRDAASDELADEVDAVSTAVTDARTEVESAATPPEKLTALQAGAANVQDAVTALRDALPECD